MKSIEDKAAKASKSAAAPIATARAESKKRKETDAPKAVVKKRKMAKNVMDAAEEVVESAHVSQKLRVPLLMLVSQRLRLLAWTRT